MRRCGMARAATIDPAPRLCPGGNRHRAARTFNSRCRSAGDSAIHALTAGPIDAMILGVMSGVTLGDTGRDLTANRATVVVFVLINAAAIVRVAASWNMGDAMISSCPVGRVLDGGIRPVRNRVRPDVVDAATYLSRSTMSEHPSPQEAHWPKGAIFTLGHSTLAIERFLALLHSYGIERLVDIRTIPRSHHNPQFNDTALAEQPDRGTS